MNETEFDGLEFVENYIATKKPKNICQHCGKKLGFLGIWVIQQPFGLTHNVCRDCYKKYKQAVKQHRKRQT